MLSAQDRTIDSLKLVLKNAKHDTTRCNILNLMIESEGDDKVWPVFNEQLLNLAKKNSKTSPILKPFYLKYIANAFNNIGFLAQQQGDVAKALEYYHKSLKIQEEIKNKEGIARSLNNIGFIYKNQGDMLKALEYYHKSLRNLEEIKDKKGIAYSLNNIGFIYDNQDDITKALECYQRSLKIQEEVKDKEGIATSLNNIGGIYYKQKELSAALDYWLKGLAIREEINDQEGVATTLNNIGGIYNSQGSAKDFGTSERNSLLTKALDYYQKSLKIKEVIHDKKGIATALNNIGSVMFKMGQTSDALNYAFRSIQIANELGYPFSIKNASSTLKKIYKKQNKYKEAFEMYELEIRMRDSISNTETKKASIKKQFQYEYEKKATADSVKHTEEQKVKNALLIAQQAQLKQEKTQRIALYGGLILVIAFLGFVYNRFRVTQKQKVIIEQQKVLVDEAFSHLEEKNKEVLDSIHYAKRIQTALLTSEKYIARKLNELNS
jgi:tetratricopeptide (TPR) repeat protein